MKISNTANICVIKFGYNYFVKRRNQTFCIAFSILYLLLANDRQTVAADERFSQAETYYSQKNYSAAEKLLREVLSVNQNHSASLYLLGNIYVLQKRLDEAAQVYRACVQSGADTRPGQYAAMALGQLEEAHKQNSQSADDKGPAPNLANPSPPANTRATKEEERQSILRAQKEAIARNQKDYKIQADKLTIEEEQLLELELPPANGADIRNTGYRIARETTEAQIKQTFEQRRKALKEIYDRKESSINLEFKRRLAPFGAN
jgi:tetratricopeptide (TPR) repeat protein